MKRVTTTIELPAEAVTVVAAPPEMHPQRNVEAVTGIPARVYLEEIRASGFPLPVVKLGKLRLVNREGFLAYLRSQASRPTPKVNIGRAARRLCLPRLARRPRGLGRRRSRRERILRPAMPRVLPAKLLGDRRVVLRPVPRAMGRHLHRPLVGRAELQHHGHAPSRDAWALGHAEDVLQA